MRQPLALSLFLFTVPVLAAQQGTPGAKPPAPAAGKQLVADADKATLYPLAQLKLPKFPNLPEPKLLEEGVHFYEVDMPWPRGASKVWIYLPRLDAEAKSLPCVLIAPAGSNLIFGMDLGDGDRPEHLPYVKAGFAVVAYEVEGVMPEEDQQTDDNVLRQARRYTDCWAGMQDARAALDYVLAKVPAVDPGRLFAAGHSSAGTTALLFAAHEPRLAGCAAFMPIGDVTRRIPEEAQAQLEQDLPGYRNFLARSSPQTHLKGLKVPLFLFAAEDDGNVPIADLKAFVGQLQQAGKQVVFATVPEGNHYEPMLDPGIPRAIEWMKGLAAKAPAAPGKRD